MRRWLPVAAAFLVWNAAFDLQVKLSASAFTSSQVERWQQGLEPLLIRDVFTPRVTAAAWWASAAATVAFLAALAWIRRGAPASHR